VTRTDSAYCPMAGDKLQRKLVALNRFHKTRYSGLIENGSVLILKALRESHETLLRNCCNTKLSCTFFHVFSLVGKAATFSPKDGFLCSFETLVSTYESTRIHSPEKQHRLFHDREDLTFFLCVDQQEIR
jgi:hypothetical protein